MGWLDRMKKPPANAEFCNGAHDLAERLLEDGDVDTLSKVRIRHHLTSLLAEQVQQSHMQNG